MSIIRVVIIEDEPITGRNLIAQLQAVNRDIVIVKVMQGVNESVMWFNANPAGYDLTFMDIRLADGISFDIFQQSRVSSPVIFVTAYNDYAVQAFKNNGIGYVLKPFDHVEINEALDKFYRVATAPALQEQVSFNELIAQISLLNQNYKKSFLIHYRDKLIPVEAARIAWFYTANEIVCAQATDGREYHIDQTMEQLDKQLDPGQFFRANRQFIVNRACITEAVFYFNGRLSVKINPEPPEHILISKARVPEFRRWMDA